MIVLYKDDGEYGFHLFAGIFDSVEVLLAQLGSNARIKERVWGNFGQILKFVVVDNLEIGVIESVEKNKIL